MSKQLEKLKNINWKIFTLVIAISIFGVMVVLSASASLTIKNRTSTYYYALRQGIMMLIGIAFMIGFSLFDFKRIRKLSTIIWVVSIILLLAALFSPLRVVYSGYARRGLKIGFVFMPSDIYKVASVLFFSNFLLWNKKNQGDIIKGMLFTYAVLGIPLLLILIQPDLSTTITIGATLFFLFVLTEYKKEYVLPTIGLILLFIIIMWLLGVNIYGYQADRIRGWRDPEKYGANGGSAWQILNSLYAVARGGFLGVGYGKSVLKFGYLADEVHNDMIFAVIAEEFGFIVSIIFVAAIFYLFFLIMKEAIKSNDLYSKYVAIGYACLYLFQSIINIGVSINLIPNTGITLPFISYGGTSLIIYFVIMGIVLNISRTNREKELMVLKEKKIENKMAQ